MSKFKIGDEVVVKKYINLKHGDYKTETVKDLTVSGSVIISGYGNKILTYHEDELMSEAEAEKAVDAFSKEWALLEPKVLEKLKEASKSFDEAVSLAASLDLELSDFDEARYTLDSMIESGGWSSSSLSC